MSLRASSASALLALTLFSAHAPAQNLLDQGAVAGSGRTLGGINYAGGWTVYQPFDVPDVVGWHVQMVGIAGWTVTDPEGDGVSVDICPDDGTGTAPDCSATLATGVHDLGLDPLAVHWTDQPYDVALAGKRRYWAVVRANHEDYGGAVFLGTSGLPSYSLSVQYGGPWPDGPVALRIGGQVIQPAATYCTAKTNSLGCVPQISAVGFASAIAGTGFHVVCTGVRNNLTGLLLYSVTGTAALPFQGGVLCVNAPVLRTPAIESNGNVPPTKDCSGRYSLDMNAFAAGSLGGNPLPELSVPGTLVDCQWWGRDGGASFGTMLSDAVEYQVYP